MTEVTSAEFQKLEAAAMTEEVLLASVLQAAREFRWRTAHFRPARTERGWRTPVQGDGKGWPDLVLVRGDRLMFRELKREKARVRPEQAEWLAILVDAGADVGVWKPSGWFDGSILKELL